MQPELIDLAAKYYGITSKQLFPLPGGHFNQVFGYENSGIAYVLRLTPPDAEINLEATRSILAFLKFLAQGGASVPEPVKSLDSHLVETLPDPNDPDGPPYLVTVFLRASGGLAEELPVMVWEDALIESIGRAVGRFHTVSRRYQPGNPALDRPHWNRAGSCFNPLAELAAAADPTSPHHWVLAKRAALLDKIARIPCDPIIYGIIHADLHFGNIYFQREDPHGGNGAWSVTLLDFDDCAYGWFTMDISMNLLDALVLRRPPDENAFARHFLDHYLKGYQEESPLDPSWQERLILFLKLLETGLYLSVADAYDPQDRDSWIGKFMTGRRERIEADVPVVHFG
jgi:amicoumacin kinase